jgi:tripartite-type tricarboxylate transporter receptor subunit TctC
LKAGTVRLLAALIPKRDPSLPDVPTALEQGVNVSVEAWRGVAAPRGTPAPVVAALDAAIRKTAEAPEFARACEELGIRPAYMAAAAFGPLIAKEDAELSTLMQQIGLKKQP